jgi:hypothetical protein
LKENISLVSEKAVSRVEDPNVIKFIERLKKLAEPIVEKRKNLEKAALAINEVKKIIVQPIRSKLVNNLNNPSV